MTNDTAPVRVAATRPAAPELPLGVPHRNPTADRAISRADRPDPWARPASPEQLRERLAAAVQLDDGHGIQVITHILQRTSA